MDLWNALGISREAGLAAAAVGLLVAVLLAAARLLLSRSERGRGLDLGE